MLDATFANPEDKSATAESIKKTREFLGKIAEEDGVKDRSGHLALLELEKRSRQHGLATDSTTINSLLEAYFQNFGGKACCYEDLQPYVELEGEELARWTSVLEKQTASSVSLSHLYNCPSKAYIVADIRSGPLALHQCPKVASLQPSPVRSHTRSRDPTSLTSDRRLLGGSQARKGSTLL